MAITTSNVITFDDLLDEIAESGKNYDIVKISKAYAIAAQAHSGQKRKSGDPFISHPVAVAEILVDLGMDTDSVVAAILHDVVEDTDVKLEFLEKQFGHDVSHLVDGVTKLGKIPLASKEEEQAENIRKILFAMSEDIRVIIIKLADRLHNMRTLNFRSSEKQREVSKETLDIYAPIAHRLGIISIKEEIEDRAIRYLDPVGYEDIENNLEIRKDEREDFLNRMEIKLQEKMESEHLEADVSARVKSIYGIYRKQFVQGKMFDEIYDIYAMRVIVNSVVECYTVLGIVHGMFAPFPNLIKDYISTPKPNMYQSLHTTVIGKEGIPFEIQIRTWDMHYTAEYGIAAHWKYKSGEKGGGQLEERVKWVRQLLETDGDDMENIVTTLKSDFVPEEVFVFTPSGEVKTLPAGSTVIDFAYSIHSEVGNKMKGAKVNSRITTYDYELQIGDRVQILTTKSPEHGPSRDWLSLAKTSEARNKIRAWFKKERREENVEQGKFELEKEFRRNNIRFNSPDESEEFVLSISKKQHCNNIEDFHAMIGYNGVQLSKIMPRIRDEYKKNYLKSEKPEIDLTEIKKVNKKVSSGVIVEGMDDILVKFAKCCNPLPGDNIIGFITRGYGVSIHKQDCVNAVAGMNNKNETDRWIEAYWAESIQETFNVILEIVADDRGGLIADISILFANLNLPLFELNARQNSNNTAAVTVTIGISNLLQLENIKKTLKKIQGIISVNRTGK